MTNHKRVITSKRSSATKTRMTRIFVRSLLRIRKQRRGDYHKQGKSIKMAAYASMARAVGARRRWSRALGGRVGGNRGLLVRRRRLIISRSGHKKRVVEREVMQVEKLRRLVPGGKAMEYGELLEETADYMRCLANQVKIMQTVLDHFNSSSS